MFDALIENIEPDRVTGYSLRRDRVALTFSDVLDLWQADSAFRTFFTQLLSDSPFPAYRWETPALTESTKRQPFQFVLLNCPRFCSRETDGKTYSSYFTDDDTNFGVVAFANLRGDATLVVPSPRTERLAYGHLAAFMRHGPTPQREAFWQVVSTTVRSCIGGNPLWLNTAGGGVAWLHVRLDSRPKYYSYSPYKTVS